MLSFIIKRYKEPLKKIYMRYRKPLMRIYLPLHQIGNKRKCYICGRTLGRFTKFKGGIKYFPEWISKLDMIGSDVDNFGCPYCNSFDRERHLFMYFDKLGLWEKIKGGSILHFAPEPHLSRRIEKEGPQLYIKGDLFPANPSIVRVDATAIQYPDSTFDVLIANHIMEHIPDYPRALSEMYRVLKPNGIAILQTPFSKLLEKNFEDEGINTSDLKLFFYAQRDHVRIFSEKELLKAFLNAGFVLGVIKHSDYFADQDAYYFGVNKREDLLMLTKPGI